MILHLDNVKAKLEANKFQGEKTKKTDLIHEDDLIERELEDVELVYMHTIHVHVCTFFT